MSFPIKPWIAVLFVGLAALAVAGQQAATTAEPLSIRTLTLPKAYLRQPYRYRLEAQGGISPLKWQATSGSLPQGLGLGEDGTLSGSPTQAGEFHFTVTVSDSGKPVYERSQDLVLRVVIPLLAEWSDYPKISGQRVEGAIKVSNGTDRDFDLTVIILAVNEIGRATAVGYQHVALKKETSELVMPFGENLPPGAYVVNVDVVAEVPAIDTIYRARLVTKEKLQVQQEP